MKKTLIMMFAMLLTATATFGQNKSVEVAEIIDLPAPQRNGGMPLMEALNNRATVREYTDQDLTDQQLSDLLWAANGVNRDNGKRTAPSARNCQEIDVYVMFSIGVYLYDAEKNQLNLVAVGDNRRESVMQPFAAKAPVILFFVANYDKMTGMDKDAKEFYGATDAGYVSQNVYLYCASEGLGTVVLGSIHRDALQKMLGFNGKAILGQPVGYVK